MIKIFRAASGRISLSIGFGLIALMLGIKSLDADAASKQQQQVVKKIINGKPVPAGKYPWMVALLWSYIDNPNQALRCGGTLIDRQWVLTAAHCVDNIDPDQIDVAINEVNLSNRSLERIPVVEIIGHTSTTKLGIRDVALLRLKRKIPANIPLLKLIDNNTELEVGTKVTTMGWGLTEAFEISNRLLEIDLEIGWRQICENYTTRFYPKYELCLVSDTRDRTKCSGDSGGPSVIKDESTGEYYQVGITSWGSGRCDTHYGEIDTRVADLTAWIKRQIAGRTRELEAQDLSLPIRYYCVKLDCVFDGANGRFSQQTSPETISWRTDDGGRYSGRDAIFFKHRFSGPGVHEVRLILKYRNGRRIVETLKLDVKRRVDNLDNMRFSAFDVRSFSGTRADFTEMFGNHFPAVWLYDGDAIFAVYNQSGVVDYDLEILKFDFNRRTWRTFAVSRGLRDVVRRKVPRGFYRFRVLTKDAEGSAVVRVTGRFSRRAVCVNEGFLSCRLPDDTN